MSTAAGISYAEFMAEYYDHTPLYVNRADAAFYVDCARQSKGRVLELGCGTGRILLPTVEDGHDVTGLDLSGTMLARCREKLAKQPAEIQRRARLVEASMADFSLIDRFGLVTIPFRGFQHLIRVEEQIACLQAVRKHLADGGRLVLDVFQVNPAAMLDPTWMREREDTPTTTLPDGRRFRRTHRVTAFHRAEQYNDVEFLFYITHPGGREERLTQRFPFRYFFRYEMEHLLARCGFRVTGLYGNFDRSPLRDDSPEMIFVAERA